MHVALLLGIAGLALCWSCLCGSRSRYRIPSRATHCWAADPFRAFVQIWSSVVPPSSWEGALGWVLDCRAPCSGVGFRASVTASISSCVFRSYRNHAAQQKQTQQENATETEPTTQRNRNRTHDTTQQKQNQPIKAASLRFHPANIDGSFKPAVQTSRPKYHRASTLNMTASGSLEV